MQNKRFLYFSLSLFTEQTTSRKKDLGIWSGSPPRTVHQTNISDKRHCYIYILCIYLTYDEPCNDFSFFSFFFLFFFLIFWRSFCQLVLAEMVDDAGPEGIPDNVHRGPYPIPAKFALRSTDKSVFFCVFNFFSEILPVKGKKSCALTGASPRRRCT